MWLCTPTAAVVVGVVAVVVIACIGVVVVVIVAMVVAVVVLVAAVVGPAMVGGWPGLDELAAAAVGTFLLGQVSGP